MAAIDFFGYLLVAVGPGAAFYGVFIAPKSFVVLLSIFRSAPARCMCPALPGPPLPSPQPTAQQLAGMVEAAIVLHVVG
jgi:hypothetical protein